MPILSGTPLEDQKITKEQLAALKDADPENYIRIGLTLSEIIVLPFKDGLKFMEALFKAERLDDDRIKPLKEDSNPSFTIMSKRVYIDMKMKYLLHGDAKIEEEETNV